MYSYGQRLIQEFWQSKWTALIVVIVKFFGISPDISMAWPDHQNVLEHKTKCSQILRPSPLET
jgi:hypothetical protein